MSARRSTQLLVIGVSVFVIGSALVFLAVRDDSASEPSRATPARPAAKPAAPLAAAPGSVQLAKGERALTLQLPLVAGLAGYARAGDAVDVYATVKGGPAAGGVTPPYSRLVQSGVKVLAVHGPTPSSRAPDPIYVLAVDQRVAEELIFYAKFESLWLTLSPTDATSSTTRGFDYRSRP